MEIRRDKYLNDLINRMHNGMIKVITGIRRSGKSFLVFRIFRNYLLESGVEDYHIIAIELDQRKNKKYRDPDAILDYIEDRITDKEDYYILLDEVFKKIIIVKDIIKVKRDEYGITTMSIYDFLLNDNSLEL